MKANFDALSRYLIIAGALFLLDRHLRIFGAAVIVYAVWRGFSKNWYKRHQELMAFENLIFNIKTRFYDLKMKFKSKKEYKVFVCPACSQKLRIPRKKGKVTITCSKCHTTFKGKS